MMAIAPEVPGFGSVAITLTPDRLIDVSTRGDPWPHPADHDSAPTDRWVRAPVVQSNGDW